MQATTREGTDARANFLGIALAVAGAAIARDASATQTCSSLMALDTSGNISANAAPPVIYVTGSSALKPLIAALAPSMFLDTNRPTTTIVYVNIKGSCTGVS